MQNWMPVARFAGLHIKGQARAPGGCQVCRASPRSVSELLHPGGGCGETLV